MARWRRPFAAIPASDHHAPRHEGMRLWVRSAPRGLPNLARAAMLNAGKVLAGGTAGTDK